MCYFDSPYRLVTIGRYLQLSRNVMLFTPDVNQLVVDIVPTHAFDQEIDSCDRCSGGIRLTPSDFNVLNAQNFANGLH